MLRSYKTDSRAIIACERHRIKIPTLRWVRIKEKGYFPTNPGTHTIKSGTVSCKAGRYYSALVVEAAERERPVLNASGIGVDLGIKEFATVSNGDVFKNINKTRRVRKLEKKSKREQRRLSGKYESETRRSAKKGEATRQNIQKQKSKVQRLYQRLDNIWINYVNQTISQMVKNKPSYITIEGLNVSGMMKNRHLSRAVASQKFYEFRRKLESKCGENGIELRIVDRWYPSSKMCHECGSSKADLKLSDRIYRCECGYEVHRDYNASLNLRDAKAYKIV